MTEAADRLRTRLAAGPPLIVPGAFDALSARLIEAAGFEAVYASGAGIANAYLGVPDLGILSGDEFLANLLGMRRAVSLPVIADLDTGHGGVHNVGRSLRRAVEIGVGAVQIEDQAFPKRCGHFDDKELIPIEEMTAKLLAARAAKEGDSLVVVGRTDAIRPEGIDAAIERAQVYREAGADVVFVEAMESIEQVERIAREVPGPKLINLVEGGRTPFLPVDALGDMGYQIVLFANFALRAAIRGLGEALRQLHQRQSSAGLEHLIVSWEERQGLVGLNEYVAIETSLQADADALVAKVRAAL